MYIVTDAHAPNGTSIAEFDLTGRHFYAKDGRCVDKDGNIVGSLVSMSQSVRNCV
jgi:N-acetylglucosamine-6-phosphate deacetylase